MTTDSTAYNTFMHVLTFHEEVNEAEIQGGDFDIISKIWGKQQDKEVEKKNRLVKKMEAAAAAKDKKVTYDYNNLDRKQNRRLFSKKTKRSNLTEKPGNNPK